MDHAALMKLTKAELAEQVALLSAEKANTNDAKLRALSDVLTRLSGGERASAEIERLAGELTSARRALAEAQAEVQRLRSANGLATRTPPRGWR